MSGGRNVLGEGSMYASVDPYCTPSISHMSSVPAVKAPSSSSGESNVGLPMPGHQTRSLTTVTSASKS
eukprot:scaffold141518_cov130-Phaeocystis_antarctica.AAC.2